MEIQMQKKTKMTTRRWRLIVGISQEIEKYSKVTPVLIEHTNIWIVNNSQVVNLPIYDDTLLVPDP